MGRHWEWCFVLLDLAGRGGDRELKSGIVIWHAISSPAGRCVKAFGEPWPASSEGCCCGRKGYDGVVIDRGCNTWPPEQAGLRKHAVVSALREHDAHETRDDSDWW